MNRFERGPQPPMVEEDQTMDDLLREARGDGFLQRLGRSRVKHLAGELVLGSIIISVVPEQRAGALLESPPSQETAQLDDESQLFFQALNDHNAPDYSAESPQWEDVLNFTYNNAEYELSRQQLTLTLDSSMSKWRSQSDGEPADTKILAEKFPEYTYDVPISDDSWQTNVNSLSLDVLYGIRPARDEELTLLDISSSTTPEERKELGRILLKEGYAFIPEGSMVGKGAIIKHERVGEETVSQYLKESDVNPFMVTRFQDCSELVLGLMRDVNWQELEGRDKEDFRAIASWIVRSEMKFSADFVQVAHHVMHPDKADNEEHLFHSIDSWDGKEIPSVLERARTNQEDLNDAIDRYIEFIDGLNHLDGDTKNSLKKNAEDYRKKIISWQDSELGGVFDGRISLDNSEHGTGSKEVIKWQQYKKEYLDGYRADKS